VLVTDYRSRFKHYKDVTNILILLDYHNPETWYFDRSFELQHNVGNIIWESTFIWLCRLGQPSPIPIEFGYGQTVVSIVVMMVVSDNGFST